MKQKKTKQPVRILSYAGGHKNLTLLGCLLSALSAVLGLIPYVCVWLAARNVLEAWPGTDGISGLARWGWTAVWTAIGSILLYFAALMSTHIAAFPHSPEYPACRHGPCTEAAPGIFYRKISPGGCGSSLMTTPAFTEDLLAHKLPDLGGNGSHFLRRLLSCCFSSTGEWVFCVCSL